MALILTFLGKGGSGRSTMAIASAKKLANQGSNVLLVGQDSSPSWGMLLSVSPSPSPSAIAPNLSIVQLQTTQLLEQSWEEVKTLEQQYLRSPTIHNVYGQELGVLPGMDQALALNALREYDKSGQYEVIIYDGTGDINTLRMFGIPEIFSWYTRRFGQVLQDSDIGRVLSPFIQPITSAIFNVSWTADDLAKTGKDQNILEEGRSALDNPNRVAAYLVTGDDPVSLATAKYLWGGAQQVGLSVAGVLLNQGTLSDTLGGEFTPLNLTAVPRRNGEDWQPLIDALPNLREILNIPKPLDIDVSTGEVKVFLPGFTKKQVKLTQSGPELTIEAGDQRRNIDVPQALRGKSVKAARFHDGYLIISF